jgi:hypothetical protein
VRQVAGVAEPLGHGFVQVRLRDEGGVEGEAELILGDDEPHAPLPERMVVGELLVAAQALPRGHRLVSIGPLGEPAVAGGALERLRPGQGRDEAKSQNE